MPRENLWIRSYFVMPNKKCCNIFVIGFMLPYSYIFHLCIHMTFVFINRLHVNRSSKNKLSNITIWTPTIHEALLLFLRGIFSVNHIALFSFQIIQHRLLITDQHELYPPKMMDIFLWWKPPDHQFLLSGWLAFIEEHDSSSWCDVLRTMGLLPDT